MKIIGFWLSVILFVCGCTPGDASLKPVPKQKKAKDHSGAEVKDQNQIKSLFIMKYEGKEWRLDLSQTGFDGIDPTTLDRDAFYRWFSQVEKEIDRQPKSAYFDGRQLVPHQNGRKVDRAEVNHWLDRDPSLSQPSLDGSSTDLEPAYYNGDIKKDQGEALGFLFNCLQSTQCEPGSQYLIICAGDRPSGGQRRRGVFL